LEAIELTMIKSQRPLPRVVNINDLLTLAKRRLPKAVFDYVDGGAEQEVTLRNNCEAFKQVTFRPKQAVSVGPCELNTQVLEADLAFPAMLAPIGYSRLMHPGGEVAAARAAEKAGIGYILSTISGHKMEHEKAAISGPA
jgi:isopentenyl diphosphate isomerase/L-lactate dehydrogenase-like FMN-dependent dehydrogenase